MDENTKPDNFLPVWSTLSGPKRAWFGQYEHVRGNESDHTGHTGWFDEAFRWLDKYVKGDPNAHPEQDPPVEVAEGNGTWRAEAAWPPRDVVSRRMAIHPGTYTDDNSNSMDAPKGGTWSITAAFPHDAHLAGMVKLSIDATAAVPRASLVALLYDVDADGTGTFIQRGASLVGTGADGRTEFELYPDDWTIVKGHRLALEIAGDDSYWYFPNHTQQPVTINGGTADIPWLSYLRSSALPGVPTPMMKTRVPIKVDTALFGANAVAMEFPPALVAPPASAGSLPGALAPPKPTAAVRRQLKVGVRASKRRLRITVRGVGSSRVQIAVLRGRKTVARKTVAGSRNGDGA